MKPLYIRPSGYLAYRNCEYSYYLKYILGIRTVALAANLAFGTAIHKALYAYVRGLFYNQPVDPVSLFESYWTKAMKSGQTIEFNATTSPESLMETGRELLKKFPEIWSKLGYTPMTDGLGNPLLEVRMKAHLGNQVILSFEPDGLFLDEQGHSLLLDYKSPASAEEYFFPYVSEQLGIYQMGMEYNKKILGLDGVERLGFMNLIKRNIPKSKTAKGPEVLVPETVDARTPGQIAELKHNVLTIADDIRRGRFPKNPRMAWNTPCTLCEFKGYCTTGCKDGLVFPEPAQHQLKIVNG